MTSRRRPYGAMARDRQPIPLPAEPPRYRLGWRWRLKLWIGWVTPHPRRCMICNHASLWGSRPGAWRHGPVVHVWCRKRMRRENLLAVIEEWNEEPA